MLLNPKDSRSTRYLWPLQSRTSLLTWKLFGRRTDGFPEKLVSSAQSDYHSHLSGIEVGSTDAPKPKCAARGVRHADAFWALAQ
jgi:hypothetical protein